MDLNELASGGGPAIDFNGIGSTVEGTVISVGGVPEIWVPIEGKFGTKLKCPFNLKVGDEDRTLWVPQGSRLATVISNAYREAGLTATGTGGLLKVQRIADVDTGKGNPMHDYRAKYTPASTASPVGLSELADEEPF